MLRWPSGWNRWTTLKNRFDALQPAVRAAAGCKQPGFKTAAAIHPPKSIFAFRPSLARNDLFTAAFSAFCKRDPNLGAVSIQNKQEKSMHIHQRSDKAVSAFTRCMPAALLIALLSFNSFAVAAQPDKKGGAPAESSVRAVFNQMVEAAQKKD